MSRFLLVLVALGAAASVVSAKKPTLDKCEVCQDLVTAAELFVKFKGWNATQLLAGADKICSVLGGFETECTAIINSGGLPFADCIASGGNTTECCQDVPILKFCSATVPKKSDRISVNKPKMTECQVCQDFVQVAEMFVKFEGWNSSTIIAEADKLCGFLGSYAAECKAIITAGGQAFANCITTPNSNATQCCAAIPVLHICSSKSSAARLSVVKPKITECQVCQDFVQVAELFVKFEGWNASTIIAEADKLCGFLGSYAAECKAIIDAGGLPFANCITTSGSNATQCCQAIPVLHICTSSEQPELRLESQPLSSPAAKATPCQVCTDIVTVAELFVKFEGWNATTILNEADKICSILGSFSSECKALINAGGLNFTTCITTGGSGQQCCSAIPAIHVCDSKPAVALRPAAPEANPSMCTVCQDIVTVAELFIKFEGWNATTLLAEADKICSILGSLATECKAIINAGGMSFATCITTGGNTTECCTDIPGLHICTAADAPKARLEVAKPKISECQVCQDFVMVAEMFVKFEGWNATDIINEADKLCAYLGSYAATCKAIVAIGGMPFATCVAGNQNATQCCSQIPEIHICSSLPLVPVKLDMTTCQICQDFATVAELFVKFEGWNATDILNEASKLCSFVGSFSSECQAIINAGGLPLAECITSNSNTTACCQDIPGLNLCKSVAAPAAVPIATPAKKQPIRMKLN